MADAQREGLVGLTNLAKRELSELWVEISMLPPDLVKEVLIQILPLLAEEYGAAAAALAADWYDEARLKAGASGDFTARLADLPDEGRYESLAGWGVSPLYQETPDRAAALTLITGGLQRVIADAHRQTIVESTQADPESRGWRRVGLGTSCGFCRMLIDRGGVYTERSVTFRSHDHCNCAASPVWADNVVKVSREPFRQSQKTRSDETKAADNKRAREFIADKYPS